MNYTKKALLLVSMVLFGVGVSAQSADKVISNYIKAIGGKKAISKISSLCYESTTEIMGMQGTMKTTILNGKGYKQDMDFMGSTSVTCFSKIGGWSVNPMGGATTPTPMPENEFKDGKNQIFIGAPFINYKKEGYMAEVKGEDIVNDVKTIKLELKSPSGAISVYYFDANTYLIIKVVQAGERGESVSTYSDYRDVDGYKLPYKIDTEMGGGQIVIKMTVQKANLNVEVDEAMFKKP